MDEPDPDTPATPARDPMLKQRVLEDLMAVVDRTYNSVEQQKKLDALMVQNAHAHGAMQPPFLTFRDAVLKHSTVPSNARPGREMAKVHPSMRPEFEAWLQHHNAAKFEMDRIKAHIRVILNGTFHAEDWKTLLPDCLHRTLEPYMDTTPGAKRLEPEAMEVLHLRTHKGLLLLKQRMILNALG